MYQKINRDLYGVTSLLFIYMAFIFADIELCESHILAGLVYTLVILLSSFLLINTFCRKCPCKNNCRHIIPGYIALFFRNNPDGPYSNFEISLVVFLIFLLISFPQIWLWKSIELFFAFWILIIIGTIQIRTVVCKGCSNSFCPINSNYKQV